jgi:hypothetical protein
MKTVTSESTARPVEVDETSSPTTVYVRDEIEETVRADAMTGAETTVYRYTEKQFTRQEWQDQQVAKYVVDLEFKLAMLETQGGII